MARELMYHGRYDEAGHIFRDFLEGGLGWIENKIEACLNLAYCLDALGKKDSALQSLFSSFHYAAPRAEICCEIGRIFLSREQYSLAVFWYEQALRCRPEENQGFLKQDCYHFIPYMQLCVCYDRMGDTARAKEYNEKAGALKPQHRPIFIMYGIFLPVSSQPFFPDGAAFPSAGVLRHIPSCFRRPQ